MIRLPTVLAHVEQIDSDLRLVDVCTVVDSNDNEKKRLETRTLVHGDGDISVSFMRHNDFLCLDIELDGALVHRNTTYDYNRRLNGRG